jgi:hypothetical protein
MLVDMEDLRHYKHNKTISTSIIWQFPSKTALGIRFDSCGL